jgi:hypothetical protein
MLEFSAYATIKMKPVSGNMPFLQPYNRTLEGAPL